MIYKNVSYSYSPENGKALSDFSLELKAGSITALLGPNGSGKSTALGIGAGWLKPQNGSLTKQGSTAFLPQSERLAFSFSCLEYVCFGRAPHLPFFALPSSFDKEIALSALKKVGMDKNAKKSITAMSGGELQLVRIARALAQEAACIILDEPSEMLDPAHVSMISSVLLELAALGRTILFSTHDLSFALAVAGEAALLKSGRLLANGKSKDVINCKTLEQLFDIAFYNAELPQPVKYGRLAEISAL